MMNQKSKYFLVFLATFVVTCRGDDDDDEYSDDVDQKVSKLRLEGAEYLQKVMSQLHNERTQAQPIEVFNLMNVLHTERMYDVDKEENYVTPIYNITGPTPVPIFEAEVMDKAPPPISLSKEELMALYEAALGKVSHLPFLQGGSQPGEELHHSPALPSEGSVKPTFQGQMGSPVSGYYYYYFPIKSFLKSSPQPLSSHVSKATPAPPQQIHATITMMESSNNKAMEPLFMAISGFIGMALMFLFSVLFVPKFGKIRYADFSSFNYLGVFSLLSVTFLVWTNRLYILYYSILDPISESKAQFKDSPDEMANFAQLVLEAMAGKDCSERLACEIARVFRGLKANNKSLRVLEIILPPNLAHQITLIRKSAGKRAKCSYVPCKMKKPKPPVQQKPQKPKVTPWKKKETPHDLWMKHFEKEKWKTKKQQSNEVGPNRKPHPKKT